VKCKPKLDPRIQGKTQVVRDDLWPLRDQTCHRVAYDFRGADLAVRHCNKVDLVIQAGGCVGAWPRYLRTIFSKVYTFEPSAENYELMLKNLEGLDIVKFHAALSDKVGRCGLKLNPSNCGDDQTIAGDEVDTISIDALEVDPDLIYLDIQGDEYFAIKGAEETLERCSPIIAVEVDNKLARLKGDAVALLKDLGYVQFGKVHQDFLFERLP
jgi:FkbM family methyltransferase